MLLFHDQSLTTCSIMYERDCWFILMVLTTLFKSVRSSSHEQSVPTLVTEYSRTLATAQQICLCISSVNALCRMRWMTHDDSNREKKVIVLCVRGLITVKNKVFTYTRLVFWIRSRIVTRAKVTLALRTGGESVKIINLLEKWFKYRNVPVGCRATRRRQTSAQREWNRDGWRARRGSHFNTTHSNAEHQRSKITREVKRYTLHHKVKQAPTRIGESNTN